MTNGGTLCDYEMMASFPRMRATCLNALPSVRIIIMFENGNKCSCNMCDRITTNALIGRLTDPSNRKQISSDINKSVPYKFAIFITC